MKAITKSEALKLLEHLENTKSAVEDAVKEYCQNKNYPLEERWQIFCKSKLGGSNYYILHWGVISQELEDFVNSCDRYSRHETITTSGIVDDLFSYKGDARYTWITNDLINEFKEYVLDMWLRSYELDW
jgi:hypothetical protein